MEGESGDRGNRYHSHQGGDFNRGRDNHRGGGGFYPQKRNYRDHRYGDDQGGDNDNYRGGGHRYHHNNNFNPRGSTTSADQPGYQDFDSEQMGIMSKRRRMHGFGGRNNNYMGDDDGG